MMEILIMMFPMMMDQFKTDGKDVSKIEEFTFSSKAHIKEGMPVAQVIEQLGMPTGVEKHHQIGKTLKAMSYYHGKMCQGEYTCAVYINSEGKVDSWLWLKPQYHEL